MLPTNEAMKHGALINSIQNASLIYSKETGDYRGAFPFTNEAAQRFLSCMLSEGIIVCLPSVSVRRNKNKETGKN